MMRFYTPASTANPTGWRPWNSRLSFYSPGSYALPTTGLAVPRQRFANGGLQTSALSFYAPGSYALPTIGTSIPSQRFANGGLGQNEITAFGLSIDPTLLAMGSVLLIAAVYLFGRGAPKRKGRRLRKRITRAQSQLRGLAV